MGWQDAPLVDEQPAWMSAPLADDAVNQNQAPAAYGPTSQQGQQLDQAGLPNNAVTRAISDMIPTTGQTTAALDAYNAKNPFGERLEAGLGAGLASPFIPNMTTGQIYDQMRATQASADKANPSAYNAGTIAGLATNLPLLADLPNSLGLVGKTATAINDWVQGAPFASDASLLAKAGNLAGQSARLGISNAPVGFAYGYGSAPEGQQLQGGIRGGETAGLINALIPGATAVVSGIGKSAAGLANDFMSVIGQPSARASNMLDSDLLNNAALPSNTSGSVTTSPAQAPDVMRQALENVAPLGESVGNIQDSLNKNMGVSNGLYDAQNLLNQQKKDSGQLFQDAFSENPSVSSPTIDKLLQRPAAQAAFKQGIVNMQNAGQLVGSPDAELGEQARLQGLDVPGGVAPGLNMETLHYIKGDLDDQIGSLMRSGKKQAAIPIIQTKNALLNEMDNLDTTGVPEDEYFHAVPGLYAQARNAYSTPAQSLEALQSGRDLFNNDPELNQQLFEGMGDTDRQFSRIGTNRAVQDIMNNSSNPVGALANKLQQPDFANNLKMQFPNEDSFNNFVSDVNDEATKQSQFSKILDRNPDGSYVAPADVTMDNVLKNPTKFSNYMDALQSGDPQNQEAAYDAMRSHVMDKLSGAFEDNKFNPSIANKVLKNYGNVIDSPAFTQEQRLMINSLPGKPSNSIPGLVAKLGAQSILGAGAGYEAGGYKGAALGALGAPLLANMGQLGTYNTANLLRNAAASPALSDSIIQGATSTPILNTPQFQQSLGQIASQLGGNQ